MDLQTRKIEFIQEFLKIQNEKAISKFEKLLAQKNKTKLKKEIPMSLEELHDRINKSEDDFNNNRFKSSDEILSKYKQ